MSRLIFKHPHDKSNYSKTIVDLKDFRAVGEISEKSLFIISSTCHVYEMEDLTIKDFLDIIKINADVPVNGTYVRNIIACGYCNGTGLTDWVTQIVGRKNPYGYADDISFKADPSIPIIKTTSNLFVKYSKTTYIYTAFCDEPRVHCKHCHGTGLFMVGYIMQDPDEKATVTMVTQIGE
jgi:hypothetical protein